MGKVIASDNVEGIKKNPIVQRAYFGGRGVTFALLKSSFRLLWLKPGIVQCEF